jgi:hypothetical protein
LFHSKGSITISVFFIPYSLAAFTFIFSPSLAATISLKAKISWAANAATSGTVLSRG